VPTAKCRACGFAVAVVSAGSWKLVAGSSAEGKLRKLAEDTGGRLIEARGMNKIADAFDQISEELHHQYSLGYYPENTNWDGGFRKIEIVAADHHDRVTARKGYYAIPPEQR
jgi:VWFA-related protein